MSTHFMQKLKKFQYGYPSYQELSGSMQQASSKDPDQLAFLQFDWLGPSFPSSEFLL